MERDGEHTGRPRGPAGARAGGHRGGRRAGESGDPLRVEVGRDAAMVLELRRTLRDAEFEATMREALGLRW